ncbi:tetratricopeptide repeat protein [Bacillus salitolerans]|uniref:Tetratricopeptide repeat protein n=1 Tax=Bacillus salitolerans TaxID=1437434 RepID=A0ABW4LJ73_9BACI
MTDNLLPIILITYLVYAIVLTIWLKQINKRMIEDKKGIYFLIVFLGYFIPVAGIVLGFLALFASHFNKKDLTDNYQDYIDFDVANYEEVRMEAVKDLNLISFSSSLDAENSNVRKELIVRLLESDIMNQGQFLQKALMNKDSETVHYAATTINFLKERFEKEISQIKTEFSNVDMRSFKRLSNVYQRYLESNILNEFMSETIRKEFKELTERAIAQFSTEFSFHLQYVNILQKEQKLHEAIQYSEKMIEQFPHKFEGYLKLMELSFTVGEYQRLKKTLEKMDQMIDEEEVPTNMKPLLSLVRRMVTDDEA